MTPRNKLKPSRTPTYSWVPFEEAYFEVIAIQNKVILIAPRNKLKPLRTPTYSWVPFGEAYSEVIAI